MRHLLCALALFVAAPSVVSAQSYVELASYSAVIGAEDFNSSTGKRLTALGDVLQQDRANFFRFGISQPGDAPDPFFADRDMRARIPGMVVVFGGAGRLEDLVRAGRPFHVEVLICGTNGQPAWLGVIPDWIEDRSGC